MNIFVFFPVYIKKEILNLIVIKNIIFTVFRYVIFKFVMGIGKVCDLPRKQ